jgi:hypothetical protein
MAHDGHFTYWPDSVFDIFRWKRGTPLVSLSSDGNEEPSVFVYSDILLAASGKSFSPSPVVEINGQDADQWLSEYSQMGMSHDPDANFNEAMLDLSKISQGAAGSATGYFAGGGLGQIVYPGAETALKFANGTEKIWKNQAKRQVDFTGVTNGEDLYKKFLTSTPEKVKKFEASVIQVQRDRSNNHQGTSASEVAPAINPPSLIGYPKPFIQDSKQVISGFFLEGAGHENVAVLSMSSFEGDGTDWMNEAQRTIQDFIQKAKAAGKTKLVIDLSSNGGGYIIAGYELFKQLFPQIEPFGGSRYRTSQVFMDLATIYSTLVANGTRTKADPYNFWDIEQSAYAVNQDLDVNLQRFKTIEQKYGPYTFQNDQFSNLVRWNLSDTWNTGLPVTGYGSRTNFTQPFASEDILLLYNGACASTCTIFSELMRQQAGVKTVAFGGRPGNDGLMQAVGQVKGAQVWNMLFLYSDIMIASGYATPEMSTKFANDATSKFVSPLPFTRSQYKGSVNYKDGLREGDAAETPLQFYYEPADCRMYYTAEMTLDVTTIWKAASESKWIDGGRECAIGDYDVAPQDWQRKRKLAKRGKASKTKTSSIQVQQAPAELLSALYDALEVTTDLKAFSQSGGTKI